MPPVSILVFMLVAALASIATFWLVLRPMFRARPRSAIALILGLTVLSGALYRWVGTPLALDAGMVERPETLEQALVQLERNRANFPDHEGWVMLATTYSRLGRAAEAREAWTQAIARAPDDANFLAAAAEARAQADPERRFDATAVEYLQRALRTQSDHQRARFFLGIALRQQGKHAEAARTWEPLLSEVDAANGASLRAEIDAARRDAGLPPLPAADAAPAAGALRVKVSLDPAFAARVRLRGDASVFVIARAAGGPPMPVAVEKHPVSSLPLEIVLDDRDGPMPTAKLSALQNVEVLARLSESGDATRREGDIETAPVRVKLPADAPVTLVLGAE
jgi:cytochrome c-type biogenesis protein CcmH